MSEEESKIKLKSSTSSTDSNPWQDDEAGSSFLSPSAIELPPTEAHHQGASIIQSSTTAPVSDQPLARLQEQARSSQQPSHSLQTQSTQPPLVEQELGPDQLNGFEDETYLQALHQELMLLVDSYQENFAQLTRQSLHLNESASLLQQRQIDIEGKEREISQQYQQLLQHTQQQHDPALDMDQLKQHLSTKLDQFLDQIAQTQPLISRETAFSMADFEGFTKKLESVNQQKMVLLNLKERVQQQQEKAQKMEQRLTTYEQLQIQKQIDLAQRSATLKAREKALQSLEKKSQQQQQAQESMAQQQQQALQQLHDQVNERAHQLREKDLKLQEAELKLTEQRTRLSQQIDDLNHTIQQLGHQKVDLQNMERQLQQKQREQAALKEQLQQQQQGAEPAPQKGGKKTIWTLAITVPLLILAYYLYEEFLPSARQPSTLSQPVIPAPQPPAANSQNVVAAAPPTTRQTADRLKNSTDSSPTTAPTQQSAQAPQPPAAPQPPKKALKITAAPAAEPSNALQKAELKEAPLPVAEPAIAPKKAELKEAPSPATEPAILPQKATLKVTAPVTPEPPKETKTSAPAAPHPPAPAAASIPGHKEKQAEQPPVEATQTANSSAQKPSPSADQERAAIAQKIEALLKAAQVDIRRNRLSWPTHDNALIKIRKALVLHPNHAGALQSIQKVANRYAFLVNREIQQGDLAKARIFLSKAQSLAPDSAKVKEAAQALATAK
ncbi:hypothetical protein [Magnetococcus sp. PR-3]|uniref:hypothetical protein n=1 Tax=Magnetococcus sp. PR-3 TaxID=3120355 RepID=UPI002FCDFCCB